MRLSEAIRLGSMMKPQAFGRFFDGNGTCAQGAALDCLSRLVADSFRCHTEMQTLWPWSYFVDHDSPLACRIGGLDSCPSYSYNSVNGIIAHLNNDHKWTRERIADFVEQIENQQQPVVPIEESTHA